MMSDFAFVGEGGGNEQSWINISILAGIALVLGLASVVAARRMNI